MIMKERKKGRREIFGWKQMRKKIQGAQKQQWKMKSKAAMDTDKCYMIWNISMGKRARKDEQMRKLGGDC